MPAQGIALGDDCTPIDERRKGETNCGTLFRPFRAGMKLGTHKPRALPWAGLLQPRWGQGLRRVHVGVLFEKRADGGAV